MMDLLPPVGWGDIATTSDLAMLRTELSAKLDGSISKVDGEIARLDGRIHHRLARIERQIYVTTVVGNATVVSLVLALLG